MEKHGKSKEQLIKEQDMRERIMTKMLLTLNLDRRLEIILDELTAFFGVDMAGIYIMDDKNIKLYAHRGLPSHLLFDMLSLPASKPPDWLRKTGLFYLKKDKKYLIPEFAAKAGIESMINVPLFVSQSEKKQDKKWLGSIFVADREPDSLSASIAGFLESISYPLTLAIDHSLSYRKAGRRLVRLETLHEIDRAIIQQLDLKEILHVVLDHIPKELGADAVAISLLNGRHDSSEVFLMKLPNGRLIDQETFEIADSLLHWFVERKEIVIIHDLAKDPRLQMHRGKIFGYRLSSYLGVPLVVHENTIGILHILTVEPSDFELEDVNFFRIMAGQVAIAIDNIRMFESVKSHALALEKSMEEIEKRAKEQELLAENLRKSRDGLAEAHRIAQMGNWDWDTIRNRLYWSEQIYEIFGVVPDQFPNTYEAFLDIVHPDDRDFVKKAVYEALSKGKDYDIIHRILLPDGSEQIVHERAEVIFDESGKPVRMFGTVQDITKLKQMEQHAIQQEKMASLGRVAMGIAHEIRNPLSGINITLDAVKENLTRLDGHEETVNMIIDAKAAAAKIERVTKRVMDFTRPVTPKILLTDINTTIRRAIELSKSDLEKSQTELITNLDDSALKAYADNQLIEQMMLNMISNALEAMEGLDEGKKLFIGAYEREKFIIIKIGDSGHGLYLYEKETIFEPFYTRKRMGSGIGLSICKRIVTDHGGTIEASDSSLGGAEFTIKIPVDQRA